jgi:hypothetical protein
LWVLLPAGNVRAVRILNAARWHGSPLTLTHNICNFCSSSLLDRLPIRERKGSIHLFPDRIPKIVAVALGCGLALQLGGAIRALDAGRYPHPLRETKFTPPLLHFLQNQRAMVLPKH